MIFDRYYLYATHAGNLSLFPALRLLLRQKSQGFLRLYLRRDIHHQGLQQEAFRQLHDQLPQQQLALQWYPVLHHLPTTQHLLRNQILFHHLLEFLQKGYLQQPYRKRLN